MGGHKPVAKDYSVNALFACEQAGHQLLLVYAACDFRPMTELGALCDMARRALLCMHVLSHAIEDKEKIYIYTHT